jgi:hypothetical protein
MQQFVVPQFIDVEDKVIGPITVRQFIIMLVGFLIAGISYKFFNFTLFVVFGLATVAVFGVFAFLKINGRPFHYFILTLFQTFRRTKLRVWHHAVNQVDYNPEKREPAAAARPLPEKHYFSSRLAELSLIVDTKGAYRGEDGSSQERVERGV